MPPAIVASAPGKILVGGEYAILNPGESGLAIAVSSPADAHPHPGKGGRRRDLVETVRPVRAIIRQRSGPGLVVRAPSIGQGEVGVTVAGRELRWASPAEGGGFESAGRDRLRFVRSALLMCVRALEEAGIALRAFDLTVEGDPRKLGLGASSAVTVAVTAAVLSFHGWDVTEPRGRRMLFALSLLAHHRAQGLKGSGFDVAAAVFGGAGEFVSGDLSELGKCLECPGEPLRLLDRSAALPRWEAIEWPAELQWSIGWTGEASETAGMLESIGRLDATARVRYDAGADAIGRASRDLLTALRRRSPEDFLQRIGLLNGVLTELGRGTGLPIMTTRLRRLVEIAETHGCRGKSLGAGGGDCGICFSTSERALEETRADWLANGVVPLDLQASARGVEVRVDEEDP